LISPCSAVGTWCSSASRGTLKVALELTLCAHVQHSAPSRFRDLVILIHILSAGARAPAEAQFANALQRERLCVQAREPRARRAELVVACSAAAVPRSRHAASHGGLPWCRRNGEQATTEHALSRGGGDSWSRRGFRASHTQAGLCARDASRCRRSLFIVGCPCVHLQSPLHPNTALHRFA
jgi:hypothetical protein